MSRPDLRIAAFLLALVPLLVDATQVQVVGLFPGAAVLNVDGQRKLVKVGQTGPGGVQVISADSKGAVLRVDGVERSYSLSREYNPSGTSIGPAGSGSPPAPQKTQLSIARGNNGHYQVAGSIEGHPVQFLVDTGATSVAMNENQARRLGIDYRVKGQPMKASTAAGTVNAWRVTLDRIKVGSIEVLGVEGAVVEGEAPVDVLLGMSFLNRVRWREEQGVLMLESKF
ncbi:TIGR02281 family clan AA aspartic protease [Pseudomonas sp. JS3066]|jgi:aspartyl protease family protein|uniref:retropepsin-like aspartic protease family protein n=1 Tax=unclassified Pseudomonas TaxID=196821 RepID=UPI00129EFCC3|nr:MULTISPECIES: TIGR02281 family clan AA aspartic protease [unclassified Pseudomonas]MDH4651608.1 TIGR02281 family clan AA aspartic protease [Pseudomonas sp. BN606]MRK20662.1 TIGR02281 family clan AA aspartic protease [Pseudomonas sp. JG-B]WVK93787.1 TIGR02281 family clan AA aspartic protease [Pseudomonas sp. JS3066]